MAGTRRTAIIAGSTGLVGSLLLRRLLESDDYARVIALARRAPDFAHPHLEVVLSDFGNLEALIPKLAADDAFCCLGTTTAKAGGRAGLERVDYHMVVDFARAAHGAGARRLFVVSSVGTSKRALSFYSRTKARMEAAVAEIGYDSVDLVRPSLLLGARGESRPAEQLAQKLAPLLAPFFAGALRSYRPVEASAVADALLRLAQVRAHGVRVHHLPLPFSR